MENKETDENRRDTFMAKGLGVVIVGAIGISAGYGFFNTNMLLYHVICGSIAIGSAILVWRIMGMKL